MVRLRFCSSGWRQFGAFWCVGLLLCFLLNPWATRVVARSAEPTYLSEAGLEVGLLHQGVHAYRAGDYASAASIWQAALEVLPAQEHGKERALLLENLARTAQQLGQSFQAVDYWQRAVQSTQALGDRPEQARLSVELAQAYNLLGHHRRAFNLLCGPAGNPSCRSESALALARSSGSVATEIAALGTLGETYRLIGEYSFALQQLKTAQALAKSQNAHPHELSLWVGLGSVYEDLGRVNFQRAKVALEMGDEEFAKAPQARATEQYQQAQFAFEQALALVQQSEHSSAHVLEEFGILLHLAAIYAKQENFSQAQTTHHAAHRLLPQLPPSQGKVLGLIHLARSLDLSMISEGRVPSRCLGAGRITEATLLLEKQALPIAQKLQDQRAIAFVKGELGHLAECQGNSKQALKLTQASLQSMMAVPDSLDSLYLLNWQMGRILKAQGKGDLAIAFYQEAVAALDAIRSDLLATDPEIQFDFRETIEPIYRDLAALQLASIAPLGQPMQSLSSTKDLPLKQLRSQPSRGTQIREKPNQKPVMAVLKTIDSLKVAELQNYLGGDCDLTPNLAVTEIQNSRDRAAVINTIIFPDRTAVIASFPDGQTQVAWIELDSVQLRAKVSEFRRGLESYFRDFEPEGAQEIYHWLIRPFEFQLQKSETQTLVFVHDGIFRTVPMAALHDGQVFLIEHYAIAVTPSLQLTDPHPLKAGLSALALGLTEESMVGTELFDPLPHVAQELMAVAEQLPETQTLLNQEFSRSRLERALAQKYYPILHIATHGKFGAEPENNFIVTGDQNKITIQELDGLIRRAAPTTEPIELLALTACETAIGDERATLGLAGVAIRAGARSAVASLWSINDAATAEIVERFYGGLLKPELNRAQALQAAQVALIRQGGEMAHPARWAPLILIGNWL